jgi:hypothetical protein
MSFVAVSREFRHSGLLPLPVKFPPLYRALSRFSSTAKRRLFRRHRPVDKTLQGLLAFTEACLRADAAVGDLMYCKLPTTGGEEDKIDWIARSKLRRASVTEDSGPHG